MELMRTLIAAIVLPLLASCGGGGVDEADWRSDLKAADIDVTDMAKLRDVYLGDDGVCGYRGDALMLWLAKRRLQDGSDQRSLIDFEHACPERLDQVRPAIAVLDSRVGARYLACAARDEDC